MSSNIKCLSFNIAKTVLKQLGKVECNRGIVPPRVMDQYHKTMFYLLCYFLETGSF